MAEGTLFTGQAELSKAPTIDNHAVPLWYLKNWDWKYFTGYPIGLPIPDSMFPNVRDGLERKAVYVDDAGYLAPVSAREEGGAERTLGVVLNNRLFTNGTFVRGFGGLQTGKSYWIQLDGSLQSTALESEGVWSVRIGTAINTDTLYINIHIAGIA